MELRERFLLCRREENANGFLPERLGIIFRPAKTREGKQPWKMRLSNSKRKGVSNEVFCVRDCYKKWELVTYRDAKQQKKFYITYIKLNNLYYVIMYILKAHAKSIDKGLLITF